MAANDEVLKVMTRYKKAVDGEDNGLLLDTSTDPKSKADGEYLSPHFMKYPCYKIMRNIMEIDGVNLYTVIGEKCLINGFG